MAALRACFWLAAGAILAAAYLRGKQLEEQESDHEN